MVGGAKPTRRGSFERQSSFGSISSTSSRKRPRTPRPISPAGERGQTLLSQAVDREDIRHETLEKTEAKKLKKTKSNTKRFASNPNLLMEEIGCSCAQCIAATNILSRGRHTAKEQIQLDEKSWLECFDQKHRYGSNLRAYYKAWGEAGMPGKHFWDWLDSDPRPDLSSLPRAKLEREVVTYLTESEREQFRVNVVDGLLSCEDGTLLDTGACTADNEWIFVLSAADQVLYAHRKETKQIPRFHHTSFLAAEPVQVAGQLEVREGRLQSINLHSGHYRPREDRDLLSFLDVLEENGVDLATIRVDVQRMLKSSRHAAPRAGAVVVKERKRDNRKMWKGLHTRWFLEHKKAAVDVLREIRSGGFKLRKPPHGAY